MSNNEHHRKRQKIERRHEEEQSKCSPGLEVSRRVAVDADSDRPSCGVVSDLGGGAGGAATAAGPSRSSRTSSSDEVGGGGIPTDDVLESDSGGRWAVMGLVVRREVRLSGDEDCDSSTTSTARAAS